MADSHGAATILDRVSGWGHEDATSMPDDDDDYEVDDIPDFADTIDGTLIEELAARALRLIEARVSMSIVDAAGDPDTPDDEHPSEFFYEEDGDPDNTYEITDSEFKAIGRASLDTDFQKLDDSSDPKRAEAVRISIIDRGDFIDGVLDSDEGKGWGHEDGTLDYRNDDD